MRLMWMIAKIEKGYNITMGSVLVFSPIKFKYIMLQQQQVIRNRFDDILCVELNIVFGLFGKKK